MHHSKFPRHLHISGPQTIPLNYATGDTLGGTIVTEIAEAINNVSSLQHGADSNSRTRARRDTGYTSVLGQLTASTVWTGLQIIHGSLITQARCSLRAGTWYGIQHYNYSILGTLSNEALNYSHAGDLSDSGKDNVAGVPVRKQSSGADTDRIPIVFRSDDFKHPWVLLQSDGAHV